MTVYAKSLFSQTKVTMMAELTMEQGDYDNNDDDDVSRWRTITLMMISVTALLLFFI